MQKQRAAFGMPLSPRHPPVNPALIEDIIKLPETTAEAIPTENQVPTDYQEGGDKEKEGEADHRRRRREGRVEASKAEKDVIPVNASRVSVSEVCEGPRIGEEQRMQEASSTREGGADEVQNLGATSDPPKCLQQPSDGGAAREGSDRSTQTETEALQLAEAETQTEPHHSESWSPGLSGNFAARTRHMEQSHETLSDTYRSQERAEESEGESLTTEDAPGDEGEEAGQGGYENVHSVRKRATSSLGITKKGAIKKESSKGGGGKRKVKWEGAERNDQEPQSVARAVLEGNASSEGEKEKEQESVTAGQESRDKTTVGPAVAQTGGAQNEALAAAVAELLGRLPGKEDPLVSKIESLLSNAEKRGWHRSNSSRGIAASASPEPTWAPSSGTEPAGSEERTAQGQERQRVPPVQVSNGDASISSGAEEAPGGSSGAPEVASEDAELALKKQEKEGEGKDIRIAGKSRWRKLSVTKILESNIPEVSPRGTPKPLHSRLFVPMGFAPMMKVDVLPKNSKSFNTRQLMRLISSIYAAKMISDGQDEAAGVERQRMCELIYDFMLHLYGLKALAESAIYGAFRLIRRLLLTKEIDESPKIRLFMRFTGMVSTTSLPEHDLCLYLRLLSKAQARPGALLADADDGGHFLNITHLSLLTEDPSLITRVGSSTAISTLLEQLVMRHAITETVSKEMRKVLKVALVTKVDWDLILESLLDQRSDGTSGSGYRRTTVADPAYHLPRRLDSITPTISKQAVEAMMRLEEGEDWLAKIEGILLSNERATSPTGMRGKRSMSVAPMQTIVQKVALPMSVFDILVKCWFQMQEDMDVEALAAAGLRDQFEERKEEILRMLLEREDMESAGASFRTFLAEFGGMRKTQPSKGTNPRNGPPSTNKGTPLQSLSPRGQSHSLASLEALNMKLLIRRERHALNGGTTDIHYDPQTFKGESKVSLSHSTPLSPMMASHSIV